MGLPSIGEEFLRTIEDFAQVVGIVTSATNKSGISLNEEDISEYSEWLAVIIFKIYG